MRRAWVGALVVCAAAVAEGDTLVLAGGKTHTRVRVLAIGPEDVAFATAEGAVVFCARHEVLQLVDERGQARGWSQATERDPVAVVTELVNDGVRLRPPKGEAEVVQLESVLRVGDELWTGPYGRAVLRGAGGELLRARGDAVLRGDADGVRLNGGTLRVEKPSGSTTVLVRGGKVEVQEGQAALEVRPAAVRVTALEGHAVYTGDAGFRVELPRNHALDVLAASPGEPVAVIASNANAWPVRLQVGERWLTVQPGERAVLVGTEAALPPAAGNGAASASAVARVVRVLSGFQLRREGQARHVNPAAAEGLELVRGDRISSLDGTVWIEEGSSRLELFARSEVVVAEDERGPTLGLVGGEAHLSGREVLFGLPWGDARVRGAALLRVRGRQLLVATNDGLAVVSLSTGLRLRVPAESSVSAVLEEGDAEWSVRAQPGSAALQLSHDELELALSDGALARCARDGEFSVTEVHGARLELDRQVSAKVGRVAGRADPVLSLADGRRYPLVPGTYRIARQGNQYRVQALPTGVEQDAVGEVLEPVASADPDAPQPPTDTTPAEPRAPVQPPPPPGQTRTTLANGAVLTGMDWGPIEVKRQVGDAIEVVGPGGAVWVGPEVHASFSRTAGGGARLLLADGRRLTTVANGPPLTSRLEGNGWLRVEVDRGGQRRAVAVEAGCDFELVIMDDYVATYVYGQLKYVEPGQSLTVSRTGGMRTTQLP
ncbi:MAG: hypothetical protein KDD82_16630 [Planctomycetes bacterium]|nr:hypothetical protein [Planctomycetota bacterium]